MPINPTIKANSEHLVEKLTRLSEPELSALIRYHNRKYFLENAPEITDEAFDKLVEALRFINEHAEALSEIGPQVRPESFGNQVSHAEAMLSLEKCYDDATFTKWASKIGGGLVAMPKIDGVACSIQFSAQGKLIQASTRGDGKTGENITKNALLIHDLPHVVPIKNLGFALDEPFNIRGEVYLPLSTFQKRFQEEFASPRNLAAGFLKLKNADDDKCQQLRFFPYDIRGLPLSTEEEKFSTLSRLGFSMMPWSLVHTEAEAISLYLQFLQARSRYDFELDGVVFRANLITTQRRLGETAHHPRYALAYKFHGDTAPTKLIGVEWSVARSGSITPVAIVEPVFVSGASIRRASLHNLGIFNSLDLHEESLVEITRRGGVIPHLERVLSKKGTKLMPPEHCPSCGGPVTVDGDFLRCHDPLNCENVMVSKLIHFCHVLGIEGMGEKIIKKLYDNGIIKNFGDIFRLSVDTLLTLERMGDVLAHKLVDEINSKRSINLAVFIRALGIPEIGSNVSELIANNWPSLEQIKQLSMGDLLAVHGIGESIAQSFISGIHEHRLDIDDLLTEVFIEAEPAILAHADTTHPFYQKSVLFTGKMAHLERKAAQETVKKVGGKTPDAMSKHIDYLVIGDEGSPLLGAGKKSTKHKQAEKILAEGGHVKIISESEFLAMLQV